MVKPENPETEDEEGEPDQQITDFNYQDMEMSKAILAGMPGNHPYMSLECGNTQSSFAGSCDRSILVNYVNREQANPGSPIVWRCTLCGKSSAQKHNALNHVENIHFPGSFMHQCHICQRSLKSKEALNNHVRTHKDI